MNVCLFILDFSDDTLGFLNSAGHVPAREIILLIVVLGVIGRKEKKNRDLKKIK